MVSVVSWEGSIFLFYSLFTVFPSVFKLRGEAELSSAP